MAEKFVTFEAIRAVPFEMSPKFAKPSVLSRNREEQRKPLKCDWVKYGPEFEAGSRKKPWRCMEPTGTRTYEELRRMSHEPRSFSLNDAHARSSSGFSCRAAARKDGIPGDQV